MKTRSHPFRLAPEALEDRRLLATLVNSSTMTYQDIDGDQVTVRFSRPILTSAAVANTVFDFSVGSINGNNLIKQQLRQLSVLGVAGASDTNVTLTATASNSTGGDGFAALGEILANVDLGAINIDGDLGRLIAGDSDFGSTGVASLSAHSIGRYATSTGAANLNSVIQGRLGTLDVTTDVKNAFVDVDGGANGTIGVVRLGGSLLGGGTINSGGIRASGDIGSANIRGSMQGGEGDSSGRLASSRRISSVHVGGSIIGAGGTSSGGLSAGTGLGAVRIEGGLLGGSGESSGRIRSTLGFSSLNILGSVTGGIGERSGSIFSGSTLGVVRIIGGLFGGSGLGSGGIMTPDSIETATIDGSVHGGLGDESGRVSAANIHNIRISGSLLGGGGTRSGSIESVRMRTVYVGQGVVGGGGFRSGYIADSSTTSPLDSLVIGGALVGGTASQSGSVELNSGAKTIRIAGDIVGGDLNPSTGTGVLKLGGSVTSLTVGGSVIGRSASASGNIRSSSGISNLSIGGDIRGGNGVGTDPLFQTGNISADRIGSMTLGGSLIAGTDGTSGLYELNAQIFARMIGSLSIRGSVLGNATARARISFEGNNGSTNPLADLAIESLRIDGGVERSDILVGYDYFAAGRNADAQIGTVRVGGSWIASNLLAGAAPGFDGDPGNTDDTKLMGAGVKDIAGLYSKINSVTIGGAALGTVGGSDHFGIVAEIVGSLRVGPTAFVLANGKSNDDRLIGLSGDFRVNEI